MTPKKNSKKGEPINYVEKILEVRSAEKRH